MQDRRLAAIMFTDIVGYTALMGNDEDQAFKTLRKNRDIQRPIIKKYRGEWLKEMGDGILASFNSSSDAVRCAGEIQLAAKKAGIGLRIGIHEGEVVFEGRDVLGDGVNIASRLEPLASSGEIYISESVYRNVSNKEDINAEFVSEEILKNVKHPVRIYKVDIVGNFSESEQAIQSRRRISNKSVIWALVIAVLLLLIYSFSDFLPFQKSIEKTEISRSIAILPFKDLSPDSKQEWFSNGIMEEIQDHLVQIQDLHVISLHSSKRYKDSAKSLREIGNDLDVSNILLGSVRKQDDKVKISVRLVDVDTDHSIWSDIFDGDLNDVFTIQSEVAQEVASALMIEIQPETRLRIEKKPTSNMEAYNLYLQARQVYRPGNFQKALPIFEKVIQLDPNFADAYVYIGFIKSWFGFAGTSMVNSPHEAFQVAKRYYDKALEIDPDNYAAQRNLAQAYLWYTWDFVSSEKEHLKVMKLHPNARWTELYLATGQFEKAVEDAENDLSFDPLNESSWVALIISLYFNNQHQRALELINTMKGTEILISNNIGRVYLYLEEYENALETIKEWLKKYPTLRNPRPLSILAIAYYHLGEKEKSMKLINEIKEISKQGSVGSPSFHLAMIYAQMGEINTSIEWLEKAYQDHEVEMYWLKVEPPFEPVRHDPRYQAIIDKMGYPDY